MNYIDLQEEAKLLLAHCALFSIEEHKQIGEAARTSVNEATGLATRLIADQAKVMQTLSDDEEAAAPKP